jgi:hypothetical protein
VHPEGLGDSFWKEGQLSRGCSRLDLVGRKGSVLGREKPCGAQGLKCRTLREETVALGAGGQRAGARGRGRHPPAHKLRIIKQPPA